ncbi:MAG: hypothetical protein K9N05_02575 [Candidatus Marinimicrobia bacterium]|nr:hypothetical protein [Candidatus Neomarinimicrobiota bacterium]
MTKSPRTKTPDCNEEKMDESKIHDPAFRKTHLHVICDLYKQRRNRFLVMSGLLITLIMTAIYGTLENPFKYTLSNIGNFFTYREVFIIWAIIAGLSIQTACVSLFKLEKFEQRHAFTFVIYASIAIVASAIIPALKDTFPFWHFVHVLISIFYALFLILGLQPFLHYVSKENPRLRKVIAIWQYVILGGSFLGVVIFGMSGIFEIWFITTVTIFLLYLSLILYEENIVKKSVELLRDEENLNIGIEKIFVPENPKKKAVIPKRK